MIKRGKKIITKFLFLAMCTSLLPTTIAFAEEENVTSIIQTTGSAVSATSITLNNASLTLIPRQTAKLTATVLPSTASNKEVKWESSDKYVATVDENGLVTSTGLGTATITCTAVDGSGQFAKCLVTSSSYTQFAADIAQIALYSNGSTGYEWQYNIYDDGIIEEVSKNYIRENVPIENVGCGGTDIWSFKGLKIGSTKVTFRYLRSWEGEAIKIKTFLFIVDNELGVTVKEILGNECLGDVNNDSAINILDYIALKKYISNNSININTQKADINKDSKINILDLVALKKLIVI